MAPDEWMFSDGKNKRDVNLAKNEGKSKKKQENPSDGRAGGLAGIRRSKRPGKLWCRVRNRCTSTSVA
jgi:hypothetical protein